MDSEQVDLRNRFAFVEIGNTYSEYCCETCGLHLVVAMEDRIDDAFQAHQCSVADSGG